MAEWTIAAVLKEDDPSNPLPRPIHAPYATQMQLCRKGAHMFLLKRWKAILAWSTISLIIGVFLYWAMNRYPPYIPEWTTFIDFFVFAVFGAIYIMETEKP